MGEPRLWSVCYVQFGLCLGQGWGQVQLVKYSNTSSTRNQVQVLCIFTNQVHQVLTHQVQVRV